MIAVVEHHERARRRADLRARFACQIYVAGLHQLEFCGVEGDGETVRAEGIGSFRVDVERAVLDDRGERVRTGGAQPCVRPGVEVAVRVLLQRLEQVLEGRGTEGVLLEVVARAGVEVLAADVVDELLEDCRALGIGDAVKILARGVDVRDLGLDGVRRGQLVLRVCPVLTRAGECRPRLLVLRGVDRGVGAHELREGFLEPQIVPPARRDQIAEPHVAHLVEDGVCAARALRTRGVGAEEVAFREGHQARVLHRAEVVFRNEDGVVLAPRVRVAVVLVEEVHALRGELEDFFVEVLRHGRACPGAELRGHRAVLGRPRLMLRHVRTRGKRREVRRQFGRGREVDGDRAIMLSAGHLWLIGEYGPTGRGHHRRVEDGLEVRLINAREDTPGIGRLEVGVEVDVAVRGVLHAVQALARARVRGGTSDLHGDLLPYRHAGEVDARAIEAAVHGLPVDEDLLDGVAQIIHEELRIAGHEPDGGTDVKLAGLRGLAEVEVQVVAVNVERGGAGRGLCLGEVAGGACSSHGAILLAPPTCVPR